LANVKTFRALRPRNDLVARVASLPYDVMDRKEAELMAKGNPYSFLHIIRSEIDFPSSIDPYDLKVYLKAQMNLKIFEDQGILVQDEQSMIYIYRQIIDNNQQTGFVASTSVDDYVNNIIKKHELTLFSKEIDRINHFDYCDANTEPVLLIYRDQNRLNEILDTWTISHEPEFDIVTGDAVRHILWTVNDNELIEEIINEFAKLDSLYIADGHHRTASAAKIALKRKSECPNYKGEEEFNFFMSVIFPQSHLNILSYNRVVHDLNGLTVDKFINELSDLFDLEFYNASFQSITRHMFGMYINKQWYQLTLKNQYINNKHVLKSIDTKILEDLVLKKILGIRDLRNSSRISFIGGIKGLDGVKEKTDQYDGVGFVMFPVTIQEIMDVADAGLIMPAKTTWFEPKLLSGLFVHKFDSKITVE
jgi:glutamate dehydrogenase (NADP+)